MKTRADNAKSTKSQAIANTVSATHEAGEPKVLFEDRRQETIARKRLAEKADNSPQAGRIAQMQAQASAALAEQVERIATAEKLQANSAIVQKKDEQRANNTGLPDTLKAGIEGLSGFSMDDVQVHCNSSKPARLQAHAFAQGTDIHMGPGQQKHLPHEAWHVVQQKQGRVQPTRRLRGKVDVNDDAQLEKEADVMGAKASKLDKPAQLHVDPDKQADAPGKLMPQHSLQFQSVIQRLPTLDQFRAATKINWTIRWKVTTLDKLISNFHALAVDEYGERLTAINQILQACQRYIGLPDAKAKRKEGVRTLLDNANDELPIYLALTQMTNAGSLRDKYNKAVAAQDLAVQQENAGNDILSATSASIGTAMRTILADININEPATLNLLAQDDLQRLRSMLGDPLLPPITRDVITEVLGNMDRVGLVGTQGNPGARLAGPLDNLGASKYKVAHGLDQGMGTAERLGSLVHELTHVAAGESYDNTSSFLMFATTLAPDRLQQLGEQRVREVAALRELCENDVTLNAKQKGLLQGKINYGYENKLPLYAARFQDAAIQLRGAAERLLGEDPASVEGLRKRAKADRYDNDRQIMMAAAAAAPGQSSVFIEYETVMNQMLIYLHQWHIPTDNPFYAKLRQVAQDSYNARDAARS